MTLWLSIMKNWYVNFSMTVQAKLLHSFMVIEAYNYIVSTCNRTKWHSYWQLPSITAAKALGRNISAHSECIHSCWDMNLYPLGPHLYFSSSTTMMLFRDFWGHKHLDIFHLITPVKQPCFTVATSRKWLLWMAIINKKQLDQPLIWWLLCPVLLIAASTRLASFWQFMANLLESRWRSLASPSSTVTVHC